MQRSVKSFIAPVWILAATAFIRFGLLIIGMIAISRLRSGNGDSRVMRPLLINSFFVILLVTEAFIYWRRRRKIYNKLWVFAHLLLTVLSMAFVPLIFIVLPILVDNYISLSNPGETMRIINQASFYFFWGAFIAGNGLFVAIILKSYQFKPDLKEDAAEILDEYS